jgi:hypothetical protein
MAFPTSNLSLNTVCAAYGVTPISMSSLRGKTYYDPGTYAPTTVPASGSFSLGNFFGKFILDPSPLLNQTVTSTPIPLPASRPTPTGFSISLLGGDGGGGGGGGSATAYGGGGGGNGGGGASIVTPILSYDSGNFSAITITFPTAGAGGNGGGGGVFDGSSGAGEEMEEVQY